MKNKRRKPEQCVEVKREPSGKYSVTLLTPQGRGAQAGIFAVCKYVGDSFELAWAEAQAVGDTWGARVHFRQP